MRASRRIYGRGRVGPDGRWVLDPDKARPPTRVELLKREVDELRKQLNRVLWHVKMNGNKAP